MVRVGSAARFFLESFSFVAGKGGRGGQGGGREDVGGF